MSESEVKKFGKDSAIYKIWDAWQENRLKIEKESATAYENAIKNAKDYATQIAQINGELAYQNELISKNSKLTEAEKSSAISRNTASRSLSLGHIRKSVGGSDRWGGSQYRRTTGGYGLWKDQGDLRSDQ
ncbi:MAG: hypothetical protein II080_09350 [Lachnospiraceae bacterium]|nr:hypothetical protein [Lachnospiraceae bacterium]